MVGRDDHVVRAELPCGVGLRVDERDAHTVLSDPHVIAERPQRDGACHLLREAHVEPVRLEALAVRDSRRRELVVLNDGRALAEAREHPLEEGRFSLQQVDVVDAAPHVARFCPWDSDDVRERMRLVGNEQVLVRARREQNDDRDAERHGPGHGEIEGPKDAPKGHGPRVDRA